MTQIEIEALLLNMTLLNLALFFIAVMMIKFMRPLMDKYHTKLYNIEPEQIGKSFYSAMAHYKNWIMFFNVVPLIALKML